ncbi:WD40 repeat domain-containing protein [Streptomyces djakartensis]|uniref:WD40 repeat domain-containing protein n=1 Tax=Streptomyces djakartensis TaxID=68193 RepID=A0ABQ3AFT6_9ACTN|nr:WD40 repeat domain-containing protein [Streptomyces djakartensis]GGY50905.1 hypothetical protein GCM10010384_66100 [Streptomyces djakartensis]
MTEQQAQRLLTDRLPAVPQWDVMQALVKATGHWALLLGIANKFIAEQVATGADPTTAARALLERLRAGGPAAQDPDATLDLSDPDRRNTAVRASIKASTTLLQPDDAEARFAELGIFAEDEAVPMALVVVLWQATSGREETATRSLCKQMADLSLLHIDKTVPGGTLTLHDVVRDYLRAQLGIAGLQAANAALLDSLAPTLPPADDGVAWWQTTIGYLQDHLIEHLLDAGLTVQAQATAEDFRWIRARLHQRGPTAPWRDLDRIGPPARSLARQLSRAAHLLAPTNPPHALDAILRSRITDAPNWPTTSLPGDPPALINRWPPPDLPDPALLRTLTNHTSVVNGVAFSPDGAALATTGGDGTVRIWDPTTGQELHTLTGHTNGVTAVAMSPDGSSLATTNVYRSVQIWDPTTGQELRTLTGHTNEVTSAAFSPDGSSLATTSFDGSVRIWNPATGQELRTLTGHTNGVTAVAMSPDGSSLATTSNDQTVRIWDLAILEVPQTSSAHTGPACAVVVSSDGAWLATSGFDETVWIWEPVSDRELRALTGHTSEVTAMAFSPDGTWLATAGFDRKVRIWDPARGRELRTLTGHTNGVTAVAFSPDGTWLATTSNDQTARIWSPATGMVLTMMRTNSRLFSCAWTPDGHALLVGGLEGLFGYRLFQGSPGM